MRTPLARLSRNRRLFANWFVRRGEMALAMFRRTIRDRPWEWSPSDPRRKGHHLLDGWRLRLSRAGVLGLLAAISIGLALWVGTGSKPAPPSQTAPAAVEADAGPPPAAPSYQPEIAESTRRPDPDLTRKIDALLDSKRYRRASWGVDVRYVDGGAVLYSRDPLKYFIPASNVKVFTTAAVLDRLGPNFRFETRLGYEGQLQENGVLNGDLVLIGGGDPGLANNLDSGPIFQHLDNLAREVERAGIRLIQGDVVGDDSFFSYAPHGRGWNKKDLEYHYAPRVSALSFYDNLLNLVARPGRRTGQPIRLASYPSNSLFQLVNMGTTVADGPQATGYLYRSLGNHKAVIGGQIPVNSPGWTRRITMEDPALYTATLLRDRLRKRGIRVGGSVRSRHTAPTDGVETQEIYVHESPPLIEVIFRVNRESHNLYAEILLRTLGAVVKGRGSDSGGLEVVYELLREAGVPLRLTDLQDGSGLSEQNLITPRAQSMLLKHVTGKSFFPFFLGSLPVAGRNGTLRGRMGGTPAANRVFAKTGTLSNAITLGGYVQSRSSELLAFSILVNDHRFGHYNARRGIDQICSLLAKR
jgi:D-alanyl-D-alanine carboxypeptidase/D-alanyl-D-alanine-endopeptidase (penicillin-binding protein 4)